MSEEYASDSAILKALAHPVRLRIVYGLVRHECNVDKIVKALKIPQSTVSQHLALLKTRGVLQVRKEGVRTCYRVIDPRIVKLLGVLKGKPLGRGACEKNKS
ncbi:MAG: metalloregulator ArsR/SmtB family transcription factor [Kiritimatiellia bacterium]|jgi:ArsR family transcriptional regulator